MEVQFTYDLNNKVYLSIYSNVIQLSTIKDYEVTYNGNEFIYPTTDYEVVRGNVLKNDSFMVYAYYVDEYNNVLTDEFGNYTNPINVGTYYIYLYSRRVVNNVDSAYEVEYVNNGQNKVVINKLDIAIKPIINEELTYNFSAQDFTYSFVYVGENSFIGLDSIEFDLNVYYDNQLVDKLINAGEYLLEINDSTVVYSSNYNVTYTTNTYMLAQLEVEIELSDKHKIYDGVKLEFNNEFVLYDKKLNTEITNLELDVTVKYNNTPINAGEYSVSAINATAVNNIDSNFKYIYGKATYIIDQREITVELKDKSKTYDGTVIMYDLNSNTSNDLIVNNLIDGDEITLIPIYKQISGIQHEFNTPTHSGEYSVSVEGYLGAQNYIITSCNEALITINKLEIEVSTLDKEYTFSGNAYSYPTVFDTISQDVYSISNNSIVNGEKLLFDVEYYNSNNEIVDPIFSGEYIIKIDTTSIVTVANGQRTIYDDYLIINTYSSVLTINTLQIELELYDVAHTYNDAAGYSITVNDDYMNNYSSNIKVLFVWKYFDEQNNLLDSKPVNAGIYYVEYSSHQALYKNMLSQECEDSIVFTSNRAEIIISKRKVTITPNSDYEKIYDGIKYSKEFSVNIDKASINNDTGLLSNHKIACEISAYQNDSLIEELINAGEYVLKVTAYNFVIGLEQNYEITCETGIIEIQKRPISIGSSLVFNRDYNDKPIIYNGSEWIYTNDSLEFVGNDTISVDFSFIGDYISTNDIEKVRFDSAVEACKYTVEIDEIIFEGNSIDNYLIDYSYTSSGNIYPINVTVKTDSYEGLYNGAVIEKKDNFTVISGVLLDGHIATYGGGYYTKVYGVTDNVGVDNEVNITIYKVVDGNSVSVSKNYIQNTEFGKIIVHPRQLTINTLSQVFTYNSKEQKLEEYSSTSQDYLEDGLSALLEMHTLNINSKNSTKIRNVYDGVIDNVLEFTIVDNEGNSSVMDIENDIEINYIDCYDITYNYGKLEVLPFKLNVSFNDCTYTYSGVQYDPQDNVFIYDEFNNPLVKKPLLANDQFQIAYTIMKDGKEDVVKYGGTYIVTLESVIITDSKGKHPEYKDNYEISFLTDLEVEITVEKKDITYRTSNISYFWDGNPLEDTGIGVLYDGNYPVMDLVVIRDPNYRSILMPYNEDGTPNNTGKILNAHIINIYSPEGLDFNPDTFEITGTDLTDNYNINYEYGELSFDNELHLRANYDYSFNNQDYVNSFEEDEFGKFIWLNTCGNKEYTPYKNVKVKAYITGYYSLNNNQITNEMIYCGDYNILIDPSNIVIYLNTSQIEGEENWVEVSGYETFYIQEDIKFNILQAIVFVRPQEKIYVYDGTPILYEGYNIAEVFNGELGYNHHLKIYTQIDENYTIGRSKTIGITSLEVYSIDEFGEYVLFEAWEDNYDFVYYDDSVIVNEVHNQIEIDGIIYNLYSKSDFRSKFKCSEISLGISTPSASKIYDGEAFRFTDYTLLNPEALLPGHSFKLDYWDSSLFKAGVDDNTIGNSYWKVYNEIGNDVTKYYTIDKKLSEYGELEITKRSIIISSGSAVKKYDGEALSCNEVAVEPLSSINLGLADGDYIDLEDLEFEGIDAITVGEYSNVWSKLVIRNSSGKNVTKSYDITAIYGTLTVLEGI